MDTSQSTVADNAHVIERARDRFVPALRVTGALILVMSVFALSTAAFGANPLDELSKAGTVTGGVDPHGDSWQSIRNSLEQFAQPQFVLRLFLSFTLAVGCAWVVGWHPRHSIFGDPLGDVEARKTLLILGLVGAVVAELSAGSSTLAFVIFGIGALLRFRTVLDNPKLTGKAVMAVVIGLACGMGSWVMAVFVTAFTWVLIYYLESNEGCRLRIRLDNAAHAESLFGAMPSILSSRNCRLQSSELNADKGQMVFHMLIPCGLDPKQLEAEIRAKLPQLADARIDIQAV
jgi:hypothetical protein